MGKEERNTYTIKEDDHRVILFYFYIVFQISESGSNNNLKPVKDMREIITFTTNGIPQKNTQKPQIA